MSRDENQENWPEDDENYWRDQGLWDVVRGPFQRPPEEHLKVLMKQIYDNNLEGVRETLDQHKGALKASLDDVGQTPMHAAARSGHLRIVEELIARLQPQDQLIRAGGGFIPLSNAAYVGVGIDVATAIFEANRDTLITPTDDDCLPVTLAYYYGQIEMGRHLYNETITRLRQPDHTLGIHNLPYGTAIGANLLGSCFISQQLVMPLTFHLCQLCPQCETLVSIMPPILAEKAMFIAFSANIVMMLHKTSYLWVYPPIILLAIVLVIFFAWLQLSSFYEMVCSTYFPRIFNKEESWLRNIFNEERDQRAIVEGHELRQINPGPALSPV